MPAKSKTKCIHVVGKSRNIPKPTSLVLCNNVLPFVSQADHLGNILTEYGDMETDVSTKRAKFIQLTVEVREMFKFGAPPEVVKAMKIHCT